MWLRIALTEAAQVAARGKGTYLGTTFAVPLAGGRRMSQVPWNFGGGPVIIRRL
jgi:hypothetical protein